MRTLDEYRKARPHALRAANAPELRAIAVEAVRIEALTNDENWDFFLRYVEAAIRIAERLRDAEDLKLRNPMMVNDDAIRLSRARAAQLDTRIEVFKEVLMLPRLIKDRGDLARTQLEDLAQGGAFK